MKQWHILFVFVSVFSFSMGGKIPSTFHICKRSDPDLNGCFAKAVQDALPYVKEPIPELGLPSFDPVQVDTVKIEAANTGAVNVTQILRNVKVYNVLDSTIPKAEVSVKDKDFKIVAHVKSNLFNISCDYEMEGKILLLPIVGKGKAHVEIHDLESEITVSGHFKERKGKQYAVVEDCKVVVVPSKVTFDLENLFGSDERLGAETNKLFNENWREVYSDLRVAYEESLAAYFKNIFTAVFDRVPYDELFPV